MGIDVGVSPLGDTVGKPSFTLGGQRVGVAVRVLAKLVLGVELAGNSGCWDHRSGVVDGGNRGDDGGVVSHWDRGAVSIDGSLLAARQVSVPESLVVVSVVVVDLGNSNLVGVSRNRWKDRSYRDVSLGVSVRDEHGLTPLPGKNNCSWVRDHGGDHRSYGGVSIDGDVSTSYAESQTIGNVASALHQTVGIHVRESSLGDAASTCFLLRRWATGVTERVASQFILGVVLGA